MASIQIDIKDGLSSSVAIKGPCRVATTANITLSGEQTIDGVAVVTDDRVLVKDQTAGADNGIYVADTGAWRRAKDFNKTKDIKTGTTVNVYSGSTNAGWWQVTTTGDITVGTTSIAFAQTLQPYDADLAAIAALSTQPYGRSLLTLASSTALAGELSSFYQPLDADLTSWSAITRAAGFDTFVATPSSANLAALLTDETGSGANVFANAPTIISPQITTSLNPTTDDGAALGSTSKEWSDLFLASGGVINWNNGNVTITHNAATNLLTFGTTQTLLVSSPAGNGVTHAISQIVLRSNDTLLPNGAGGFVRFQTPNTSGTILDGAEINGGLVDATAGGEDGLFDFSVYRTGTPEIAFTIDAQQAAIFPGGTNGVYSLGLGTAGYKDLFLAANARVRWANGDAQIRHATDVLFFEGAATGYFFSAVVAPSANDGAPLGTATVSWSDLFLATGGVINWNNGNYTVTHTAGTLTFSGAVLSAGATGGIGYSTGAGGTVTQATSKSTGVTLNKATGQITMNAAALAASTTVSFVLTNSAIAATDLLVLNHISGGTAGSYTLNARAAAGSATIDVRNVSLGSLSEAIVIGFAVIKAVTA